MINAIINTKKDRLLGYNNCYLIKKGAISNVAKIANS